MCFKERSQISRVNNPNTIRIKNAQILRYYFYMSICVAQFPHLYQCNFKCMPIKTLILFRQAVRQNSSCNLITSSVCMRIQSSYLPPNFFLELHQGKLSWEQRVFDRQLWMFLKSVAPENQGKSLKTVLCGIVNRKYNTLICRSFGYSYHH